MPPEKKETQARALRKRLLTVLYDLYLFPQPAGSLVYVLRELNPSVTEKKVHALVAYLEKKNYVAIKRKDGAVNSVRITSLGADVVEGAIQDRGVLPAWTELSGLVAKKGIRKAVLMFLAQYPESFSGDDEILAELYELGMRDVHLDEARFHIWYLSGKALVEMKTHPLSGDMVYCAKITALGTDVVEGHAKDSGVTFNEQ